MDRDIIGETLAFSNPPIPSDVHRAIHLPHDILEDIFIRCAREYHATSKGGPTLAAPAWVNLSYVSRHWRNVALNFPTLWTYLFITSTRWTEELLARSKQAPLKLHLDMQNLDYWDTMWSYPSLHLEQIFKHVERIQELRLHFRLCGSHMLSELCSRARGLRILELSVLGFSSERLPLPYGVNTLASLHTLQLTGCMVPWHSFELSGLKTLVLRDLPHGLEENPYRFLSILRCMQNLTHLYLRYALQTGATVDSRYCTAVDTFQTINLPHLSCVFIDTPCPSTLLPFLHTVIIPMKTEARLLCRVNDEHETYKFCWYLSERLKHHAAYGPKIRSLDISFELYYPRLRLTFRTSERACKCSSVDHDVFDMEWGCNIALQIDFSCSYWVTRAVERIFSHICCSTSFPDVRRVRISHPPSSPTFWMDFLRQLPDLQYLKLNAGNMPPLASILSLTSDGCAEDNEHKEMFAPGLEELELNKISFPEGSEGNAHEATDAQSLPSLYDALSTRTPHVRLNLSGLVLAAGLQGHGRVQVRRAKGSWCVVM